jgi:hypothetical protein
LRRQRTTDHTHQRLHVAWLYCDHDNITARNGLSGVESSETTRLAGEKVGTFGPADTKRELPGIPSRPEQTGSKGFPHGSYAENSD